MLNNYSEQLRKTFTKANVGIGDRIVISKGKNIYEGLLMPRIEVGDKDSVVLKMDSGYNIGIKFAKNMKIEKGHKKEPEEIREEVRFEMGKEHLKKLQFSKSKPNIAVIATGGTIVSRVDYKTGGVHPLEKPEDLLANVPELKDIVNITDVKVPFMKWSENFNYKDWQKLAELTAKELNKNEGVIILHGTDVMHYTSAILSFMLKTSKPVIITGAQRSSDRGSSDAWMNLICGAYASISDIAEVAICMHGVTDDKHCNLSRGTRVRKLHTSRRDAFQHLDDYPIARIWPNGRIETLIEYNKRSKGEIKADIKFEPKVALVKAYPNSNPEVLNWYVSKGFRGFVIEGLGLGQLPTEENSWIPILKKITKEYPVVITPQTLYGRISPNVYSNARILFNETKAIPGEDMIPEVALVKLSWVLGHTKNLEEIRKLMLTNIAGEITQRSLLV
jgi:glutamyl-tRNA(Gln) amidotransferase subunit D